MTKRVYYTDDDEEGSSVSTPQSKRQRLSAATVDREAMEDVAVPLNLSFPTTLSVPSSTNMYQQFFREFSKVYNAGKATDLIRHVYNRYCIPAVTTVFRHWNRQNALDANCLNPVGAYNLVETVGFYDTVRYYSRGFMLIPDQVLDIQSEEVKVTCGGKFVRVVSKFVYEGTMITSVPKLQQADATESSSEISGESELGQLRRRVLAADVFGCVSAFQHPQSRRQMVVDTAQDPIFQQHSYHVAKEELHSKETMNNGVVGVVAGAAAGQCHGQEMVTLQVALKGLMVLHVNLQAHHAHDLHRGIERIEFHYFSP